MVTRASILLDRRGGVLVITFLQTHCCNMIQLIVDAEATRFDVVESYFLKSFFLFARVSYCIQPQ